MTHLHERLRYRLITGPDDMEFCARVSQVLEEGYELYGSPAITYDGARVVVAQAVVLPPYEAVRFRGAGSPPVEATPTPPGNQPPHPPQRPTEP